MITERVVYPEIHVLYLDECLCGVFPFCDIVQNLVDILTYQENNCQKKIVKAVLRNRPSSGNLCT